MNGLIQERLRTLREEVGYSQEKLASQLGITRMTLAGYVILANGHLTVIIS